MKNLHLREKILLGFGTILFIMLVVFTVSLVSLLKLGKASEAILKQNYLSIEATYQMLDAIEQHYMIIATSPLNRQEMNVQALIDEQLRFETWLQIARGNITEKGESTALENLGDCYKTYIDSSYTYIRSNKPGNSLGQNELNNSLRPLLERVRHYNLEIMNINKKGMFSSSDHAKQLAHNATYTLILIGIIGGFLSIVLGATLSSIIVRPLKNMLVALEKVANGDYGVRINHHSTDELGIVSNEFNHMVSKLKEYHELNIRSILKEKQINEALLLNMEDGLFLVDSDFHISNVNRSGASFFNTEVSLCKGRHILEIIKRESLFQYIKETAEQGKSPEFPEGLNIIAVEQNNVKRYLQFILTPVWEQSNMLLGVMILLQDVTHLKQLDKLKSEFLMIASHELKTPLTSINMSISLLHERLMNKLEPEESELLQIALDDTNRLKALINDLLDLSKIETGKIDMKFESINISSVINKALNGFGSDIATKQITVESNCDPNLQVRGDYSKIALILTNLISNALRFTPQGGTITINVENLGKFIQISVADNGIGIPTEYQNRIFDKFFQVASNLNTGGTGLGLAISKEIVRAHGGSIWVESTTGEGSTFFFTLPMG